MQAEQVESDVIKQSMQSITFEVQHAFAFKDTKSPVLQPVHRPMSDNSHLTQLLTFDEQQV